MGGPYQGLPPARQAGSVCLISGRNLGDAVIQSRAFRELVRRGYADRYLVWTRPQVAFLFESIPNCDVIVSQFPVGTSKQMGGLAALDFLRAAWRIRRLRPDVTLDFFGDFRERLFGLLAGSRRHVYIGWEVGHPLGRIVRNPFGAGRPDFVVPLAVQNVYEAYRQFVLQIAPVPEGDVRSNLSARPPHTGSARRRVGLHPFASGPWKLWPSSHWASLADRLLGEQIDVVAFSAPAEHESLRKMLGSAGNGAVRFVSGSIANFVDELGRIDLLVGLDSFSVHMAEYVGIDSVMINGANDPATWTPPHASVLASSGGCVHWPCYNRPQCTGTTAEYVCVRSIAVADVHAAVMEKLGRKSTP